MKVDLYNQSGETVGDFDLPEKIFGLKINQELIRQVVDAQLANSRQVIAHTKGRGEVRGGGRKPWRQKGTGRARHASIRSPIWRGGGVTFGPTKERNFEKKINKKMKRKALFMALSSKVKDKEFMVLEDLKFSEAKTKEAARILNTLTAKFGGYRLGKKKRDTVLLILPSPGQTVKRAMNNLPYLDILSADSLNTVDILKNKYTILTKDSVAVIEKTYRV